MAPRPAQPAASVTTNVPRSATRFARSWGSVRRFLRTYWVPLVIFAVSRIVEWAFLAIASTQQVALTQTRPDYYVHEPTPAAPGYLGIVSNWDGQWYRWIATDGYQIPSADDSAEVTRRTLWAWAFPPAYPMLVRLVMALSSLSFPVAATIVSCLAGAGAMVLMYRLVARSGGTFLAGVTVLFSSFFVSSPLLQIGYSEALALFFLMAALNLTADRHYLWAGAAVVALSMTRIVTLPFLAVVLVHVYVRYREDGRFWRAEPREAVKLGILGGISVYGLICWMQLASVFIGTDAGMARSVGQRSLYLGWFEDAYRFFGPTGPVLLACVLVLLALNMLSPRARVWSPELRAWSVAYPAYLLVITPLLPAVLRYLLLAPTLPVVLAGTPRKATRGAIAWVAVVLAGLVLGQLWYVNNIIVVWTEAARPAP